MHRFAILTMVFLVLGAQAFAQPTVQQLCNRATMSAAAPGRILDDSFVYGGTDRFYCTYLPSSVGPGIEHHLLVALHGGDGNASQMMEDARGIIAQAEAMGYVAVFPNGLPKDTCSGALCLDNNWGSPDNVFFIAAVIERLKATSRIEDDGVHLVGFSGGAKLVYQIVATPGFPHAIHSVATVAGALGLYHADRPDDGFAVIPLQDGAPTSALLAHGGLDPRQPAVGGLDESTREAHLSFRGKVDYWRLLTGTETAAPQPIDVQSFDSTAPADIEAARYTQGGLTVVEVFDPGLAHAWPTWDIMAVAVELFEQ